MRTRWIAALGATLAIAGVADAQRVVQRGPGASYPVPDARPMPPFGPDVRPVRPAAPSWRMRDGRWIAGWNAPGGWNAYRPPYVGYALPRYWAQPGFAVGDWSRYRLAQPRYGYRWSRYYDDAVLIDAQGSVHDVVSGVDWNGYDDLDYASEVPVAPDYARRDDRMARDDGLGGAAIGAVAGGVAGNVIAGRGDRLGGTLIGAGVGAATGYAIDKAEDRGRPDRVHRAPPYRGAGYPPPPTPYHGAGYPPPIRTLHGPGTWVSPDGVTTVTTAGGYGGSTTTVVVQTAPMVTTTTTTEYYDDSVTYSKPAKRKTYRRKWRPSKTICRC